MIIRRNIDKDELKKLPKAAFPGKIYVVQTRQEVQKAIDYLSTRSAIGIDSETRPSFTKGQRYKVSLLQLSSEDCCFLFRLNHTDLSKPIIDLLENKDIIKVGLSLRDDFMMLRKRAPFKQRSCVELQDYVGEFGIKDKSLQKIFGILFGEKISKAQRLTNWEINILSHTQKVYAATDAWACLRIYNLLEKLRETGNYELEPEELPIIEEEATH